MLYPRYGVVPSGKGMSKSSVSSTVSAQGYRPRYCAAPAKYFTTTPIVPIVPTVAYTYGGSSSSLGYTPASSSSLSIKAKTGGGSKYFDPTYPSRQFGSRLSKSYNAVQVRPQLHEEFYGTSFLPDYGRNSWSAYRVSDAAIDDGEDIAYLSRRKDYETLRGVELAMANAAYVPPRTVRASSVPPRSITTERRIQTKRVQPLRSSRPFYHNTRKIAAAQSVGDLSYGAEPRTKVVLETVPRGRDLLTAKEKLLSREVIDLESPSGTMALKMRIADAQAMLDRQGAMLSRYSKIGVDADLAEVNDEVRRLKNNQAIRAKSVM